MALAIAQSGVALSMSGGCHDHHYRTSRLSELHLFVFEGAQALNI
jgi:hypothetical protein